MESTVNTESTKRTENFFFSVRSVIPAVNRGNER
jgi:hypothetical protein